MYNLVFTDIQGTRLIPTVPLKSPISGAALVPLRCTHRNRPSHCCPTLPSCLPYSPLYTSHTGRSTNVLYYAAQHFLPACPTLLYTPHTHADLPMFCIMLPNTSFLPAIPSSIHLTHPHMTYAYQSTFVLHTRGS